MLVINQFHNKICRDGNYLDKTLKVSIKDVSMSEEQERSGSKLEEDQDTGKISDSDGQNSIISITTYNMWDLWFLWHCL